MQGKNPIQQKLSQRKVGNEPFYEVESLLKFYEQRSGESNCKPSQAEEMIQAIETAKARGLNNISGVLYSVEPQNLAYKISIETLREYRQMESNGGLQKE